MVNLDCSGLWVVGCIRPTIDTSIGISATHCHGDFLVSFLIGSRKAPGFLIGTPDCHPRSLLGYQLKISSGQKVKSDMDVVPAVQRMIRNIGFYFRVYDGNPLMVELVLGALLEDGRYFPAGIWANHTYSPQGKQAAAKVESFFNFFNHEDWLTMQSLISPTVSIAVP